MRLVASRLALLEVLALSASDTGLTLAVLGRATQTPASAAQRALQILVDDQVVERTERQRPVYQLTRAPIAAVVVHLARLAFDSATVLATCARANPAIEFIALKRRTAIVVLAATATSADISAAVRCLEGTCSDLGLDLQLLEHDDVRRESLIDGELRKQIQKSVIVVGTLDRTFPDRRNHGLATGRPLGHPNKALKLPSKRLLSRLASRHHLQAIHLFGSAVRTDFEPGSDVDVLVSYREGQPPTLESLIDIERELEKEFGRDVDLKRQDLIRPALREVVSKEMVRII
ncbi:MAG: nucleotidyltransferase domain-containing protein [Actinomycetota bacterium]